MTDNILVYLNQYWHLVMISVMGLVAVIRLHFRVDGNTKDIRALEKTLRQDIQDIRSQNELIQQQLLQLNERIDENFKVVIGLVQKEP